MAERHTGKVKFFNEAKGFGFIVPDDKNVGGELHFRKPEINGNITPRPHDTVEYSTGKNAKGLFARDVKLQERTPEVSSSSPTTSPALASDLPTPYTFVPVALTSDESGEHHVHSTLYDVPGHDGGNGSAGERFSGEMKLNLITLTPLLVGARQYGIEPRNPSLRAENGKDRKLLMPWRLADGRVVLAGSSLKGMIRHHLSALLNAPMEKVYEQYFSYRPNLSMGDPAKYFEDAQGLYQLEMREAVIESIDEHGLKLRVLGPGRHALFAHADVITNNNLKVGAIIKNQTILENTDRPPKLDKNKKIVKDKNNRPKLHLRLTGKNNSTWIANGDHLLLNYLGGMGRDNKMAEIHAKSDPNNRSKKPASTYRYVIIPRASVTNADSVIAGQNVIKEYLRTYRELSDQQHGHLSSRHPKFGKGDPRPLLLPKDAGQVPFKANTLVYVEVKVRRAGSRYEVVALGHHFHFRLAYRDSVRRINRPKDNAPVRTELRMLDAERIALSDENIFSAKLSGARALFGYAADKDIHGNVFKDDFERLAGRISINHALEDTSATDPKDDSRFLATGEVVPLKELGSPKASAVEFYLQQTEEDTNAGRLTTYGDAAEGGPSMLAGRKFYRHQPPSASDSEPSSYRAEDDAAKKNDRALLTRFASPPNTRFRFTLRFRDLSTIELGALLFVLGIDRADTFLETTTQSSDPRAPTYALKIGHARPLGWGSVKLAVSKASVITHALTSASILEPKEGDILRDWEKTHIQAFLDKKSDLAPTLATCLQAWSYAGRGRSAYPRKDGEIFSFHTELRRHHAKARRAGAERIGEIVLVNPAYGQGAPE